MEAILSNSTRKLLWFEIAKMLIAVLKHKFIVLFIIFQHTFVSYRCHGPFDSECLLNVH